MVSVAETPHGRAADDAAAGRPVALSMAALASIAAGAVHATAAGSHSEHRSALVAFAALAAFQIGWGALALVRPQRWVGLVGAAGNAAAVGGWVLAKTSGIGFIDGLEASESPDFADTLAAALAAVAVVGGLLTAIGRLGWSRAPQPVLTGVAAVATLALAVPGMVAAGSHAGEHGDGGHGGDGHEETAVPAEPYDATLPVNLAGVPGVSAEEQADAEELVTRTLQRLPQFADVATAEARGYRSIGDALTGFEHFIKWDEIDDDTVLDPDEPESLVYRVEGNRKTLVAAMYMLARGETLETTPDIGGELVQWHIHDDLCFAGPPDALRLSDVVRPGEECRRGEKLDPVPMIHTWIVPHECGPFSALEGVGGGTIPEGETRACDRHHGSTDPDAVGNETAGLLGS